jgi:two-component sensor histidine kinase
MVASSRAWRAGVWVWSAAVWLGVGLFDATQTVLVMRGEGMHHAWARLFAVTVASWLPWAVATPLIVRIARRAWPAHLAACVAVQAAFAVWTAALDTAFNPYAYQPVPSFVSDFGNEFTNGVLSSLLLYAGIVAIWYAVASRARIASAELEAARLNESLSRAQLAALRRQIEPHFLFNALNAIAGLVREGRDDAAVRSIASLSDVLRRMLDASTSQEVSLREEMAFVHDYLEIQRVRFADRLRIAIDIPAAFDDVPVPNLILQPLVENAIKHGIARRVQGGEIRIAASRAGDTLAIAVTNDGPGLPDAWQTGRTGIGIANVRQRLQGLYGARFDVTMRDRLEGGVEVTLSVPLRTARIPA